MDGGTTFIILFDPATKLPAAIRTRDDDNIAGDSNYDLVLGDWTNVGGARVARSLSYKLNNVEVARLNYSSVTATPNLPADAFAVPAAVQSAAKRPATGNVPYQWVLRRLFLTRLTDSDAIIYPDGGALKLVELAPNVQHVQGGTANNLIVAMKDYLIVFDAPYGELQSRWVDRRGESEISRQADQISRADASPHGSYRRHAHLCGGRRDASRSEPEHRVISKRSLENPHTIVPDELTKNPKPLKIYGIFENQTIKDETAEVRLL